LSQTSFLLYPTSFSSSYLPTLYFILPCMHWHFHSCFLFSQTFAIILDHFKEAIHPTLGSFAFLVTNLQNQSQKGVITWHYYSRNVHRSDVQCQEMVLHGHHTELLISQARHSLFFAINSLSESRDMPNYFKEGASIQNKVNACLQPWKIDTVSPSRAKGSCVSYPIH
jgi:hypothetical protein